MAPTFDGGFMDSPGSGLGRSDTGDAMFPSNTWMPKGETDKSVNEDVTLSYPGPAEALTPTTFQEQIKKAFGPEYAEAYDMLCQATRQGQSVKECIETLVDNSSYALDQDILEKIMQEYRG